MSTLKGLEAVSSLFPSYTPVRVAVVYHSGSGHTVRQARAVADGAASVAATTVDVIDVETITDQHWRLLDQADAIIFGAPTYMGGPSAGFKVFADATVAAWADNFRWQGKIAAGFTNSKSMSGDKLSTLTYFALLAAQHGMHWVNLGLAPGWVTSGASPTELNRLGSWLGAMAQSNGDQGADVAPPESDLRTAAALGERVATVTQQLARGRQSAPQAAPAEHELAAAH